MPKPSKNYLEIQKNKASYKKKKKDIKKCR